MWLWNRKHYTHTHIHARVLQWQDQIEDKLQDLGFQVPPRAYARAGGGSDGGVAMFDVWCDTARGLGTSCEPAEKLEAAAAGVTMGAFAGLVCAPHACP
eukprot:COSAG01_NODE_27046_length_696_cov_0.949749_2_plen_98_part_01